MHEKNWAKAEECGRELMKPEYGYGLVNNYKDIFTLENEGNVETIWAAICSSSVNQQLWQAHVLSSQYPTKMKVFKNGVVTVFYGISMTPSIRMINDWKFWSVNL